MKKAILFVVLTLIVGLSNVSAQTGGTCGPNLTWSLQDAILTISGTGDMTNWSSSNHAPWYYSNITSIIIQSGVTSIGDWAFYRCNAITTITIPNSVTSIGSNAFYGCSKLATITIPNSVTSIGDDAFIGCSKLTSPLYNSHIFAYMPSSYSGAYTISNGIENIGGGAFSGCTRLTSVTIPNSVTNIGNSAFSNCIGLTSVTIPNSVTSIGNDAFYNCSKLNSITIPNSVTSIGNMAFYGCNLTAPLYNSHVFAFMPSSYSGAYTIPCGIASIAGSAFYGCSNLDSITISSSVTNIGDYAFSSCNNLTSVVWNAVNCSDFSSFMNTPFYLNNITSFALGDSVQHIPAYLCYNMNNLTFINIPNSVTSIGDWAFYGCSGLVSVAFGDNVRSIGANAFMSCIGLSFITIPNSVTSIGEYAFLGCSELDTVFFESSTPPHLGYQAFSPLPSLRIIVPCGAIEAYQSTGWWQSYASNIQNSPSATIQTAPLVEGTGLVNVPQTICDTILEAIPAYGYHFVKWIDGITDNPRVINPEIEATYIAEFAVDKSGKCGDDLLLTWTYDSDNHTLTISGNGTFNSNMQYGVEAPSEMTSLIIGDGVQSIGNGAFAEISSLTFVSLGRDVSKIKENAFYNCENLAVIRNYATIPAIIYSSTFDGVNKFACILYVPNESVDVYKSASGWRDFYNIQGFDAQSSIYSVTEDSATRKLYHNGTLYILLPDGTRYDATGKKVE